MKQPSAARVRCINCMFEEKREAVLAIEAAVLPLISPSVLAV
jgi:hypothetical protein